MIGVADHANISVLRRQLADDAVLHPIGVLVFVDEDIGIFLSIVFEHARVLAEKFRRQQEQVAEVEGLRIGEFLLVFRVELRNEFFVEIDGPVCDRGREQPGILPLVDLPTNPPWLVNLWIEPFAFEHFLDDADRIRIVIDDEAAIARQMTDVPAQNPHADGMERPDRNLAGHRPEKLLDALLHFPGRFIRKGHREDLFRRNPTDTDQIGDSRGEYAGLATSGASKNE